MPSSANPASKLARPMLLPLAHESTKTFCLSVSGLSGLISAAPAAEDVDLSAWRARATPRDGSASRALVLISAMGVHSNLEVRFVFGKNFLLKNLGIWLHESPLPLRETATPLRIRFALLAGGVPRSRSERPA